MVPQSIFKKEVWVFFIGRLRERKCSGCVDVTVGNDRESETNTEGGKWLEWIAWTVETLVGVIVCVCDQIAVSRKAEVERSTRFDRQTNWEFFSW